MPLSVVVESVEEEGALRTAASSIPGDFVRWTDDPSEFEDYDEFNDFEEVEDGEGREFEGKEFPSEVAVSSPPSSSAVVKVAPVVLPMPDTVSSALTSWPHDHAYIVLIRHGRTPHNNLGLFTGWEDPPLAPDGIEVRSICFFGRCVLMHCTVSTGQYTLGVSRTLIQDAKRAGRLLRKHGFEFDVVYTSWLTRAIQTAFYVMDELDCTWLPLVKSWRLNERMYGALTGKSKRQIEAEYGEDQLKIWRRGYDVRPPPVSVYSPSYPGNDPRRAKYFDELPISIKETLFRSVEERRFAVHRRFPRTESLKCCMDRTIPFYLSRIFPDAVDRGKRVLIASHENAIRGILMHLCDIPELAMSQLHLPNGLPLVYNVRGKCISLLEEDGEDQSEVHDFGPASQYLFRPCQIDDDFYEGMEQPERSTHAT
jgi:2,3-bisphosphoglycerate-dependent phosphoglycerate mutase